MMIPLREDLQWCVSLHPIAPEQLPAPAADPAAREAQIRERSFWMQRDIDQAGTSAIMCERLSEMNDLIDRNNAEAQR